MIKTTRLPVTKWAFCIFILALLIVGCDSPSNSLSGKWTSTGTCAYGSNYDTITQVEFLTDNSNSSNGTVILDLKAHGSQEASYSLLDDHRINLDNSTVIPFSVSGDTLTLHWDSKDSCTFHKTT